jgi:hypothetical protein
MGISLNGLTPAGTYPGLIKTGDNTAISGTPKVLSDGNGNDLPMEVSTTGVNFTNQLQQGGVAVPTQANLAAKQDTLVSGTNIKTINGASLLGSGNIPVVTSPSGVSGAIQFSDGSAFASDASNLFWDDTNNRLGVGTNAPTATAHIVGSSNTATDYALKVLNLRSQGSLSVTNDGFVQIGDFSSGLGYGGSLAFLRPSGASRATTFIQGNSNLSIQNVNGNVTYQNTQVQVIGSGSTSATTSLLVQNSAGTSALTVRDDCSTNIGASGISARLNFINTNGSGAAYIAGSGNGGVVEFNSSSGAGIRFSDGYGNTNMFVAGLSTPSVSMGKTTAAVASALLEMESTTKGFLPPRMTNAQRTSISSPAVGLMVYCTDAVEGLYINKSTGWTLVI